VRYRFGPFTFDTDTRQLLHASKERHLSPMAFELLDVLIRNQPRVVSKKELQERLWPSTFVSESNLPALVSEIRATLDDRSLRPRFVRTAHRLGYAFCGEAREVAPADRSRDAATKYWLAWGRRTFALKPGLNTVGRDPDADVWLDAASVSRRHSIIRIESGKTRLEDLCSKNGTFLNEKRITSTELKDGNRIRVGGIRLTFRSWSPQTQTATHSLSNRRRID
jgi:DNA-binding winged helix-turn-helix (wHTH) protein